MKLQRLAMDFLTAAESYGRIIISEFDPKLYDKTLPTNQIEGCLKRLTIKPATSIGGLAGGVKFVHNGILFKFALDWVPSLTPHFSTLNPLFSKRVGKDSLSYPKPSPFPSLSPSPPTPFTPYAVLTSLLDRYVWKQSRMGNEVCSP